MNFPFHSESNSSSFAAVNIMQLAAHQPCVRSISHCSRMQSSKEFVAQKILNYSANNRHLDRLITLQRSLINLFSSNGHNTDPCGTLREVLRVPKRCLKCVQKIID